MRENMDLYKLKYVVVTDEFENECALLFQGTIKHIEAALYFHRHGSAISGGFYYVENENVVVYGKSESLKKDSRPQDAALIAKLLGLKAPVPVPVSQTTSG